MSTAASSNPSRGVVMVDVARRAGVSQKTVSRVINDAPHVRPEIRERVLHAVDELGYRPNLAARALVTQRTHVIGLLVVGTPLYGPALRVFSLEQAARAMGYDLAVATVPDSSPSEFHRGVQSLLTRGAEGIVLEVPAPLDGTDAKAFAGLPVISSLGPVPGVEHQAMVDSHQLDAGRLATEHLLDLGHRTVIHIAGPMEWSVSHQRRDGWAAAMAAAGVDSPEVIQGDWTARTGYRIGAELARRDDVTAVFTANDQLAMGVICALAEAGLSIPADVSVVGFDDVPEAEFQMVPLTTVRADHVASSQRVLQDLVALIEGRDPVSTSIDVPCDLVVRRSTAHPPARTPPT